MCIRDRMHIDTAVGATCKVGGSAPVRTAGIVIVETNPYAGNEGHPVSTFGGVNWFAGSGINLALHGMRALFGSQRIPAGRSVAPGCHCSGDNVGIKGKFSVFVIPVSYTHLDVYKRQVWDRSAAYDYALEKVEQVLAENPSIEVVIDLHRDGVREDVRLVTEVNGKPTARIMFFNGLSKSRTNGPIEYLYNPYIADNLAFSFRLEYEAAQYYPDLTRCVYLKCYRYNLHVRPKSLLLEVGAQTNTLEEAKNAMEPFAAVSYTHLDVYKRQIYI